MCLLGSWHCLFELVAVVCTFTCGCGCGFVCACVHVSTRLIWDGQRFQKLHCYLCKKQEGACIQCEDCYKAYHAMCAQKHNCCVVWRKVNDIVVRWWSGVNRMALLGWVSSSPTHGES